MYKISRNFLLIVTFRCSSKDFLGNFIEFKNLLTDFCGLQDKVSWKILYFTAVRWQSTSQLNVVGATGLHKKVNAHVAFRTSNIQSDESKHFCRYKLIPEFRKLKKHHHLCPHRFLDHSGYLLALVLLGELQNKSLEILNFGQHLSHVRNKRLLPHTDH